MTGGLIIGGVNAARKAEAVGKAILARTRRLLKIRGFDDFRATNIEVLGSEWSECFSYYHSPLMYNDSIWSSIACERKVN